MTIIRLWLLTVCLPTLGLGCNRNNNSVSPKVARADAGPAIAPVGIEAKDRDARSTIEPSIPPKDTLEIKADTSRLIARDTGQVYLVQTPKLKLNENLRLIFSAGFVTNPPPNRPRDRGKIFGAIFVYNIGHHGLLTKDMTLGLTHGELRIPYKSPELVVERDRAPDGVVEILEFSKFDPYFMVTTLESVNSLRVDLDVFTAQLSGEDLKTLRGLYRKLKEFATEQGFSMVNTP